MKAFLFLVLVLVGCSPPIDDCLEVIELHEIHKAKLEEANALLHTRIDLMVEADSLRKQVEAVTKIRKERLREAAKNSGGGMVYGDLDPNPWWWADHVTPDSVFFHFEGRWFARMKIE